MSVVKGPIFRFPTDIEHTIEYQWPVGDQLDPCENAGEISEFVRQLESFGQKALNCHDISTSERIQLFRGTLELLIAQNGEKDTVRSYFQSDDGAWFFVGHAVHPSADGTTLERTADPKPHVVTYCEGCSDNLVSRNVFYFVITSVSKCKRLTSTIRVDAKDQQ